MPAKTISDTFAEQEASLRAWLRDYRVSLGLPPDGPPPTLQETMDGQHERMRALAHEIIAEHMGRRAGTMAVQQFWNGNTHQRDLPTFTHLTVWTDCWPEDQERALIEAAWTMPEWPCQIGREAWIGLWDRHGFACLDSDCYFPHGRPDAPAITLWRGAMPEYRDNLSWTDDRDQAEWFARRLNGRERGLRVWECIVPSERVLTHVGSGEGEWICDVAGLEIRQVCGG